MDFCVRLLNGSISVLDEVMRAPIRLQCIFPYTILANPEVEPHAPNTYQSKLVPSDSIYPKMDMRRIYI